MPESPSHKRSKSKAAGKAGETEVKLSRGRRLDAQSGNKATEVERSGNPQGLIKAAQRLKSSGKPQKVLQVPQQDIPNAVKAMQKVGIKGTVKNISGTKRRSV